MSDLTSIEHWDDTWSGTIRMRLPSPWIISTRDLQRLLTRHIKPRDRVLEIGCAPGKMLAWIAAECQADVAGLDFSEQGLAVARSLFKTLQLRADLRSEDLRQTTFEPASFDVVLSVGVIEHFDDPREIVTNHLKLLKPGGKAIMTVPNYRGFYGAVQRYFDGPNLLYHNLEIMTCEALESLVPQDQGFSARAYRSGRLSPWVISLRKRWPRAVALAVSHVFNAAAFLQPIDIPALCPTLVLEVTKPPVADLVEGVSAGTRNKP